MLFLAYYQASNITLYFRMPWMRQCGIKKHCSSGDGAAVTAGLGGEVCLWWAYRPVISIACTIAVWNHTKQLCPPPSYLTHTDTHTLLTVLGVNCIGDSSQLFTSYCVCYWNSEVSRIALSIFTVATHLQRLTERGSESIKSVSHP
jgi:hypothetical protein